MMVKEIAESTDCFDEIAFLDDNNEIAIGRLESYQTLVCEYQYAIVAIGNPNIRLSYIEKLEKAGFVVETLVSPYAYVSPSAQIMAGSIIEPMAVVQAHTTLARGCIVSSGAVVRHNACVGDVCHIDCNAVVMSNVLVPANTKVEACSVYKNR